MTTELAHAAGIPEALAAPRYSFAEAARLARVRPATSRRWIAGYSYPGEGGVRVRKPPVAKGAPPAQGSASFADLVEVAAIRGLLDLGLSLPRIRGIVENCRDLFQSERPLLSHRFRTDGRDAFAQLDGMGGELVSVLQGKGDTAWDDVLGPFLGTVDYEDEWVHRWWPGGRERTVVVDPRLAYGLPVVAGTGVRTEIIYERVEAGDSPEQIERDFGVPRRAIKDALDFERTTWSAQGTRPKAASWRSRRTVSRPCHATRARSHASGNAPIQLQCGDHAPSAPCVSTT